MANYTIQQLSTMNQADLIKAAQDLQIDYKNLSTDALRAQLEQSIFTQSNNSYVATLKDKSDAAKNLLVTSKTDMLQKQSLYTMYQQKYASDPNNASLLAAKADYTEANNKYTFDDAQDDSSRLALFNAQTDTAIHGGGMNFVT